jgi:hypothetical protein
MISEIFRDHLNMKYDSLVLSSDRPFGYPTEIIISEEHYAGLKFGCYSSGAGTHFGSSVDTVTYCNHIGVLSETDIHHAIYSCESFSYTITLLRYNGRDISCNCSSVKTSNNRRNVSVESQKKICND